jgi:hypothetical protein
MTLCQILRISNVECGIRNQSIADFGLRIADLLAWGVGLGAGGFSIADFGLALLNPASSGARKALIQQGKDWGFKSRVQWFSEHCSGLF